MQSKYEGFKKNVQKADDFFDTVSDDRPPCVEVCITEKRNQKEDGLLSTRKWWKEELQGRKSYLRPENNLTEI